MRGLFFTALFLGLMTSAAMAADDAPKTSDALQTTPADNPSWEEYKKLTENYYFLDKQKAGHISCRVFVPMQPGNPIMVFTNNQNGDKQYIDTNLIEKNFDNFSVTYDHIKGLSFDSHIKPRLTPDPKLTTPTNDSIDRVKGEITYSLNEILSPHFFEFYKKLSLIKNGDTTIFSLNDTKKSLHYKVIYSGSTQKGIFSVPWRNKTWTFDYQPLNGKLALAHFTREITAGRIKDNATASISYQNLGAAFFPSQILEDITIPDGTQQPKSLHLEIDFKDCKTSDVSP